MDFLAICQGLGLALAAGLIIGVVVPPVMPTWGILAAAIPLGVIAGFLALSGSDEAVWPALPVGAAGAALAAVVSADVAAGAARREAHGTEPGAQGAPLGIILLTALAAAALALLSLVAPPVSLVAATALAWIWLNRRRRAEQKHEGLRVLR